MRTIAAFTLAVAVSAVELGSSSEVSTEAQAMVNAAYINDYITLQVERLNNEYAQIETEEPKSTWWPSLSFW